VPRVYLLLHSNGDLRISTVAGRLSMWEVSMEGLPHSKYGYKIEVQYNSKSCNKKIFFNERMSIMRTITMAAVKPRYNENI
jgi:hypothetical protein